MTVDTACSSSLVALDHAVRTLRAGTSEIAVACGANILMGPEAYIAESKFHMISPSGRSHMWDSRADGYGRGDGVAAVVLKPLDKAIADGDHIECVIRETGVNQDGRSKGITMPNADAQVALIEDTYRRACLDTNTPDGRCQYFEAHGTGTPVGDPIEAEAIHRALGKRITGDETLSVGTIKSVIGHTEGTAGLAALLKASLALQNAQILPNLLFEKLNPKIEQFYSHLQVPTEVKNWPEIPHGAPRRASVNSFGFGGTNAHAILESYDPQPTQDVDPGVVFAPFTFSANTETSLKRYLEKFSVYLKNNPMINLHNLAWTLHSRRSVFPIRVALSGTTSDELQKNIQTAIERKDWNRPSNASSQIFGVFTGQGAQWPGMCGRLVLQSKYAQNRIEYLDSVLASLPLEDRPPWLIKDELLAGTESRLHEAALSQPLCTVVQIILVDLLHAANVQLSVVVGHSSGEIGAAYAAGFLSARDAIIIAYYRGLFAHLAQGRDLKRGSMMAVGISSAEADEFCNSSSFKDQISVAACNSPSSITLSGDSDAIEKAKEIFQNNGKFARVLRVDKAYHSYHMFPCAQPYIQALRKAQIQTQTPTRGCRWFSSVYCREIRPEDELESVYWAHNMTKCVKFCQAVQTAVLDSGNRFHSVLEVGPHGALKGPTEDTIKETKVTVPEHISSLVRNRNDVESLADALGRLWRNSSNPDLNFENFEKVVSGSKKEPNLVKDLPKYSWDHDEIFWAESRRSRNLRKRNLPGHPLLGTRQPDNTEHDIAWQNFLKISELPWLSGHQLQGQTIFPAAGYVVLAIEAARQIIGERSVKFIEAKNLTIVRPIVFEDERHGVETLFNLHISPSAAKKDETIAGSFNVSSATGKDSEDLALVASGEIVVVFQQTTSEEPSLPPKTDGGPYMVDVNVDQFYESLGEVGYQYSDSFRALSSLKRKLGRVAGHVANPVENAHWSEEDLLVHPAMLDATIQSLLLAHSWPGDGRLWSLHVPTFIDTVRIDPSECLKNKKPQLSFDSVLTEHEDEKTQRDIYGDIDVFSADGSHGIIQVEGLSLVPLAPALASQDCQLYFNNIWNVASANGKLAVGDRIASEDEIEFGWALERVSYFYLRKLVRDISDEDLKKAEWHHHKLLDFAHHVIKNTEAGKQPYAKNEWNSDTIDTIKNIMGPYANTIDVKLMCAVGENLVAAVRGETIILQHMLKDGMLNQFYSDALGLRPCTEYLAEVVSQVAHRYPRMNILEVGAGTGAATKGITRQLGNAFSFYTFTDISAGFFETARDVFADYADRMAYRVLDAEKDVVTQGFKEHSYDMLVASNVLHATRDLDHTMANVRRLLKPGGVLVLLEVTSNESMRPSFTMGGISGWWIGAESGRPWSPCISSVEWNKLLLRTGFSGVDTITPMLHPLTSPFSVMVSCAVDDRISLLLEPSLSPAAESRMNSLIIIGGETLETNQLIFKISRLLQRHVDSIKIIGSVGEITNVDDIEPMSTVLCLAELDEPVFKDLDKQSFQGLKTIFSQARNILWATVGCKGDEPYSSATVGFGRSVVTEMPHVRLQFLDFVKGSKLDPYLLVETLLRHQITDSFEREGYIGDILWSSEPEMVFENGNILVPRILPRKLPNDRYNSERRQVSTLVSPQTTKIIVDRSEGALSLRHELSSYPAVDAGEYVTKIEVIYAFHSTVPVSNETSLYPIIGRDIRTGTEIVALSDVSASIVEVPSNYCASCAELSLAPSAAQLRLIAYNMIWRFILDDTNKGDVWLLFEPDDLFLRVAEAVAAAKFISVIVVTNSQNVSSNNIISLHPFASTRSIKASIPSGVSHFVNASPYKSTSNFASRISCHLGPTTRILDITRGYKHQNHIFSSNSFNLAGLINHLWDLGIPEGIESPTISPQELTEGSASWSSVVDWSLIKDLPVLVNPADSSSLLRGDRTYLLVGLVGGLGLTLSEWMIRQGARHIVLASRNPKADPRWLAEMKSGGANIHICSWYVLLPGIIIPRY